MFVYFPLGGGGGGTPYNGLYGEAPLLRGIFFRLQVYERGGILLYRKFSCSLAILLVEVYKRVGKSVISVWATTQNGLPIILWL